MQAAPRFFNQLLLFLCDCDNATTNGFSGTYRVCRVHGFARQVRLVTFGGQAPEGQMYDPNFPDGSYWFAEEDFLRLKRQAEADLRRQGGLGQLGGRSGMYLRHQFRSVLAVRRDLTPSFDAYLVLSLPAGASVIALVGQVKEQPVYGPDFPGEASARKAGISLPDGLTQYVIRFDFEPNRHCRDRISAPFAF